MIKEIAFNKLTPSMKNSIIQVVKDIFPENHADIFLSIISAETSSNLYQRINASSLTKRKVTLIHFLWLLDNYSNIDFIRIKNEDEWLKNAVGDIISIIPDAKTRHIFSDFWWEITNVN